MEEFPRAKLLRSGAEDSKGLPSLPSLPFLESGSQSNTNSDSIKSAVFEIGTNHTHPIMYCIYSRNGLGKCAPYKGEVCAKYLKREGSSSVFEYSYSPQSLVEKQLVREFKRIKKTAQFSDR